ncbi:MAG TPA: hypothetical protein VMU39_25285 [Solirubrobacteraceae bacterium]|nr:hypothetical protein [Solirubrobacteraceae bacterium]
MIRPRTATRSPTDPVAAYYAQELHDLLERVREGFGQLDAGAISVGALDQLIQHYGRCARELREFCGAGTGGSEHAARTLAQLHDAGDRLDWWGVGDGPSDRAARSPAAEIDDRTNTR